jgi:hypothetical protein
MPTTPSATQGAQRLDVMLELERELIRIEADAAELQARRIAAAARMDAASRTQARCDVFLRFVELSISAAPHPLVPSE